MSAPAGPLPKWVDYGLLPLINLAAAFLVSGLGHDRTRALGLHPAEPQGSSPDITVRIAAAVPLTDPRSDVLHRVLRCESR